MIDVVIYQNSNSDYVGFKTNGHAGYDDPGHDIVCSAVSAIAITILNSIEELSDVNFTLDCDQESGNMNFMFKESPDIKAQALIQAFVIGISGIEESYGDYICMTFKEV